MTLKVRQLPEGDDRPECRAWAAWTEAAPAASLYHGLAWRRIFARHFGWQTHYLYAADGAGIRGILPLVRLKSRLFGDFLVSLPYVNHGGVVAADEAADQALLDAMATLAGTLGVTHAEVRETRARAPDWPVRTDKVGMRLALAGDGDTQFRCFSAKLRAQIRRPAKEGATARCGGSELLDAFHRVYAHNMRDLGTPVHGMGFFAVVLEAFAAQADVVVVRLGGQPVAAGILLHHAGVTEIPWASSLRTANRTGVNMLLYWTCVEQAIRRGSTVFDFGRSTHGSGTYRFKAQWGAQPLPMFWHYWLRPGQALPQLNPANPKYALAIRTWQRLPVWLTCRLGPPIVRNLP